jgi:hypothetical protein
LPRPALTPIVFPSLSSNENAAIPGGFPLHSPAAGANFGAHTYLPLADVGLFLVSHICLPLADVGLLLLLLPLTLEL